MIKYRHTQKGYLIFFILLTIALYFGWLYVIIFMKNDSNSIIIAVMAFILFILVSFLTLQVTIDENYLRIKFGYGIFRKNFLLKEIASAKTVKNHWYYGWGIRFWPCPRMWIYNISGFDAVEIIMKNGKIYRIGTDKPKELEYLIYKTIV